MGCSLARPGGLDCGSLVRGGASAVWRSAAVVIPLKYDLYAGLVIEEDGPPPQPPPSKERSAKDSSRGRSSHVLYATGNCRSSQREGEICE